MKVSIVTPVFNNRDTVGDCVRSVAAQNYPDIEHIVIDGGSTDGTLELLEGFDSVAELVSEPDRGIYDAMNKGIARARGDVVGILNSDDLYAGPSAVADVVDALDRSGADCAYGDLVYVDAQDTAQVVRYWRAGAYRRGKFRRGWMPPHPTFFARRELYERLGDFDLRLSIAADYELMLRFLYRHRVPAVYVPRLLVRMRAGGHSNNSLASRLKAHREDYRAWRMNGLRPAPWTVLLKPLSKLPQFFAQPPS